jgi:hypothetical protein
MEVKYKNSNLCKKIDLIILYFFKRTFLRWCDYHLHVAYQNRILNSERLHELDNQMKKDLGFKGYH